MPSVNSTHSKAHPSPNTLFVQIGTGVWTHPDGRVLPNLKIGSADDAYWGGDRGIPQNRPSYQINDTLYLPNIL